MNWVNKQKLPAIEAIKYNNQPCLEMNDLWHALHSFFNTDQHHHIDESILKEVSSFPSSSWTQFSEEEFIIAIAKCNNSSTPGPDKLL